MTEALKNIDTIIFDFDGTIADTLELGVAISNELARKFNYKEIKSKEDLQYYRSLSTQDALKAIGVSLLKLPFVTSSFKKRLLSKIDQLETIEGIKPVIEILASKFKLGIVTSNSRKNIDAFLTRHNLEDFFTYYATGIRLFKKSGVIKKLSESHNLNIRNMIMIGDETRDIETAKSCNVPIISVTWGFHTSDLLKSFNPNYIVDNPKDLVKLLM